MDATPDQVRTRADLGRELTALRVGRGISLRQLARGTGAPLATLGDYFSGRHLPGPAQLELYRSILAACGVTDPAEGDAWIEALRRARLSSDGRLPKSVAPYPGLRPFGEDDHERFFGRAAATGDVLDRLRGLAAEPGPSRGMLLLVGPSGSGKSSLLAAGVAPAVRAGALDTPGVRWECTLVRDPARLAAVAPVAAPDGGGFTVRRLVIVDQLEDVLALPPGSGARQAALAYLADPDPATVVVAAVRADFVPAATAEPALLPALHHARVLLGPMTARELREAVVGPAHRVGATVEEALVELVMVDMAPGARTGGAPDAGTLAFLSQALLATWARSPRNELTVADYLAVGGIGGVVAGRAEVLYAGMRPAEQALARRILVRLVRVDDDGAVRRRRADRGELDGVTGGVGAPGVGDVLERLVSARLVTADAGAISISHDALIRTWSRLAEWVRTDGGGMRLHHQISDAASAWSATEGGDDDLLWHGRRLDLALGWAAEPGRAGQLNQAELRFLAASAARRRGQTVAARRAHRMLAAVGALAMAMSGLAAYALDTRATPPPVPAPALSSHRSPPRRSSCRNPGGTWPRSCP